MPVLRPGRYPGEGFTPDRRQCGHSSPPSLSRVWITVLVAAEFPDDHLEGKLDLHELMVKCSAATFFCKADGDSMTGAGTHRALKDKLAV